MMISVVVPIFNEQENLPELRQRLVAALNRISEDWEIILVDDGSRDASAEIISRWHGEDPRIKLLSLSRNFGHQPALTAGIHHARGDAVVLIDGDLQDPPELIPDLVAKWRSENAQVVFAQRTSRAESGLRGMCLRAFYPILRFVTDLPAMPNAGTFSLLDRTVIDHFNRLPERNRFIPGLRTWLGFRQASLPYARQPRAKGSAKQSFRRLMHYASDATFSFSYKPLQAVTGLGFIVAAVGFITALAFVIRRLFFNDPAVTGFTTLLSMTMLLGGIQLLCLGIVGQYIGRIYEELKQRPLYIVQRKIGLDPDVPT
jgi:glycosyltransferase involved in cell wall biosynthesis